MNKKTILFTTLMFLSSTSLAFADPYSDIPRGHWAYKTIENLTKKGIIKGLSNGTFGGNQIANRYQIAMITARVIASLEQNEGLNNVSPETMEKIKQLTTEFADELSQMGLKVTNVENELKEAQKEVKNLKNVVENIKNDFMSGGIDKVKLSGDIVVRNYGFDHDRGDFGGVDYGEDHRHRTETMLRLQLDADIDENVSARVRWNITGNNGFNEWNGNNKAAADVEIAYLKINDLFTFGGDFKFGRDWYTHGHRLVVHNYMDAVSYTRKAGDVDLAFNLFFERQQNKDYFNIWNINADYAYKGHNIYFGIYYNDRAYDELGNRIFNVNGNPDKNKEIRYELGSSGKIKNNDDRFTYDLGVVYSEVENGNGIGNDAEGVLVHAVVAYDDGNEFKAKVAYTYASDESYANINVENQNSYINGDETPFDDLYLTGMAYNAGTNFAFHNLIDVKVQMEYSPRKYDRSNIRLAYDHVENKYDGKPNTFNTVIRNPLVGFVDDLKCDIITLDYTYKISDNLRFRLCYQNSKVTARNMPDQCIDLYFTELYGRF